MVQLSTVGEIADFGNVLVIPLALLPLIINFRYYRKTKIFDYLLLSWYFFAWSFQQAFVYWYQGFVIFDYYQHSGIDGNYTWLDKVWRDFFRIILVSIDALPLFLLAVRAKYGTDWSKIPKYIYGILAITLFLVVFAVIDQGETWIHEDNFISSSENWAVFINRGTYHAFLIYAFLSTDYEKSSRTTVSRSLWIIASLGWVIANIEVIISEFVLNHTLLIEPNLLLLFFLLIDFGFLFLLINHVYFPEAVLFTHEQIINAFRMYDQLDLHRGGLLDFGIERIHSYLDSIPNELKVELQIPTDN